MERILTKLFSLPGAILVVTLVATCVFTSSRTSAMDAGVNSNPGVVAAEADPIIVRAALFPPQAKRFGNEGEWTEDKEFGLSHVFAAILLSIGALIVIGWIFGWDLVLRLRNDPLPARLRTYLNRLDSARLAVQRLALRAMARHNELELAEERRRYDEIAEAADAVIEKAKTDFCLNALDEPFLVAEIAKLVVQSKELCTRLGAMQPTQVSAVDVEDMFKFGWASINRANRGWERVFAKDKDLKITTIAQLNDMRWLLWSTLKWTARPERGR